MDQEADRQVTSVMAIAKVDIVAQSQGRMTLLKQMRDAGYQPESYGFHGFASESLEEMRQCLQALGINPSY